MKELLYNTFFKEKQKIVNKVLESEKDYSKAESLTGPCNHCAENCKELFSKCKHPEIRRYSLASIGMDSRKILKDLFDIKEHEYTKDELKELINISILSFDVDGLEIIYKIIQQLEGKINKK